MNHKYKAFTIILAMMVLGGTVMPLAIFQTTTSIAPSSNRAEVLAATDLVVENSTININGEFNDDDFLFYVYNGTFEISGANVTLYNVTDSSKYASKLTIGDGSATFFDVPFGMWEWNVTWGGTSLNGSMASDGPEAFSSLTIGNLDWENDDDDILVAVTDIEGDPGEGLNFTIYNRDTNTTYQEFLLPADGIANVSDIPIGNYTYYVTVAANEYAGAVLIAENFTTDGTTLKMHQTIGPITGLQEYYDLEVFTHYETTLAPLQGALVNVTYYNGTVIEYQYTPANGTVIFVDLPVAFVNWTVSYLGSPIEDGSYSYNLTTLSTDIRSPVIASPGDQEFLIGTENITITWNITDEYPAEINFYVDDSLEETQTWTNQTSYTFNASDFEIGVYELKLVATDLNDNTAEDTISLRIFENTTPVIVGPEDFELYYTEVGETIRWNFTEENPDFYILYKNGESVVNGTLNPDSPFFTYTINEVLEIGEYNYTFWMNDTSGNWATDDVAVTIKADDIAPVITYEPPTVTYAQGDPDIIRNWTASDDYMDTYAIYVDGVLIVEDDWISETIEFDFAGLSMGEHEVRLVVTDLGGNTAESTVQVIVSMPNTISILLIIAAISGIVVAAAAVFWFIKHH